MARECEAQLTTKTNNNDEPQLVLITWRDACTYSGWRDRKVAHKETGPAHCQSVGWLLTNNKDEVTVYATRAHDPEDGDINSLISIPAAWVEKMEVLNIKSAKKLPVFYAGEEGAAARRRSLRKRGVTQAAELGGVRSWRRGLR